jgi:hypothetical protein
MARSIRKSEEDWFEYRLENDPRFLRRIEQAQETACVPGAESN